MTVHGHVRNGVIVLDTPTILPEGAAVEVEVVRADDVTAPRSEPAILKYAGILRLGPDASRRIDDDLYGGPDG
jgi:hypothetical protein